MSIPEAPAPAKLVVGIISGNKSLANKAIVELAEIYGPIDSVSPWIPFNGTEYYTSEMGDKLLRRVITFENHIEQEELSEIKNTSNRMEKKYSEVGKRLINIDPGYLLPERFVLATGKNFSHRIYIGDGIYADLTLIYQDGSFRRLPWTYPDFAEDMMLRHLETVRKKFELDIRKS